MTAAEAEREAVGQNGGALERELWTSFVSLLRSYTAAHGLNRSEQAILDVGAELLLIRVGGRSLRIAHTREGGSWERETGQRTPFRFDEHGRIAVNGEPEEMDMVAERLAREIMQ